MFGSDRLRAVGGTFHIGSPLVAKALCGEREWTALVHYESVPASLEPMTECRLCPACLRIHREQHTRISLRLPTTDK
jgi:hypothetical protein